jgi:hypothetical protein
MDGYVMESPAKKAQYYFLYCLVLKTWLCICMHIIQNWVSYSY